MYLSQYTLYIANIKFQFTIASKHPLPVFTSGSLACCCDHLKMLNIFQFPFFSFTNSIVSLLLPSTPTQNCDAKCICHIHRPHKSSFHHSQQTYLSLEVMALATAMLFFCFYSEHLSINFSCIFSIPWEAHNQVYYLSPHPSNYLSSRLYVYVAYIYIFLWGQCTCCLSPDMISDLILVNFN